MNAQGDTQGNGPAVLTSGLHVRYGNVEALRGLDLACHAGSVTGVIGPNGAGKSTLVHVLADLVRPDEGRVEILGRRYGSHGDSAWIRRRAGFLISGEALLDYLTGREFIDFLVDSFGLGPEGVERSQELCALLELDEYLDRVVAGLSRGNRKKLATVSALLHDPAVLVLDEPFEALDPLAVARLRDRLRSLADAGRTVLVTSHILSALERICDEVVVIHRGSAHLTGSLDEVKARVSEMEAGAGLEAVFRHVVEGKA